MTIYSPLTLTMIFIPVQEQVSTTSVFSLLFTGFLHSSLSDLFCIHYTIVQRITLLNLVSCLSLHLHAQNHLRFTNTACCALCSRGKYLEMSSEQINKTN